MEEGRADQKGKGFRFAEGALVFLQNFFTMGSSFSWGGYMGGYIVIVGKTGNVGQVSYFGILYVYMFIRD